jgi:hypothetical protein
MNTPVDGGATAEGEGESAPASSLIVASPSIRSNSLVTGTIGSTRDNGGALVATRGSQNLRQRLEQVRLRLEGQHALSGGLQATSRNRFARSKVEEHSANVEAVDFVMRRIAK